MTTKPRRVHWGVINQNLQLDELGEIHRRKDQPAVVDQRRRNRDGLGYLDESVDSQFS